MQAIDEATEPIGPATIAVSADPCAMHPVQVMQRLIRSLQWPSGMQLESVDVARVWAGKNGRLTIEHRIRLAANSHHIEHAIQGVASPERLPKLRNQATPEVEGRELRKCFVVDDRRTCWIASPDGDPEFPLARDFFSINRAKQTVRFGSPDSGISADAKLIAYRAGRRFVVRMEQSSNRPAIFMKAFRKPVHSDRVLRVAKLGEWLEVESGGVIRVPELVRVNGCVGVIEHHEIRPNPTPTGYGNGEIASAMAALVVIHRAGRTHDRLHEPADELDTAARWQAVLDRFEICQPSSFQSTVDMLKLHMPPIVESDCRVIHRDFYHNQILRNESGLWLVDWDTLCCGHPEQDVATYAAHAVLHDLLEAGACNISERLQTIEESYRLNGGGICPARMKWYQSCALIRLAAMHSARMVSPRLLRPLWETAEKLASELHHEA